MEIEEREIGTRWAKKNREKQEAPVKWVVQIRARPKPTSVTWYCNIWSATYDLRHISTYKD